MDNGLENTVSLASIAGHDVSEVQAIRSERLPMGVYVFEIVSTEFGSTMVTPRGSDDEELRFVGKAVCKVIEVQNLAEPAEGADLVGRSYTESFWINPAENDKAQQAIGYMKGFFEACGMSQEQLAGGIGGVADDPNIPEGFLDRAVGVKFIGDVKKVKRNGEEYADMKPNFKKNTAG